MAKGINRSALCGTVLIDDLKIETDGAFVELNQDDDQIVLDRNQAMYLQGAIAAWIELGELTE